MKHRHIYKVGAYGGPNHEVQYVCKCGHTKTVISKRLVMKLHRKRSDESDRVHQVWHSFATKMKLGAIKQSDWKVIQKAEKVADKYPKDIVQLGCDDGHHSSSRLFAIAHRDKKRYWMGVTVVGLMQNDGQEPFEFFLYPNHVRKMIEALQYMEQLQKACKNGRGR